MKEAHAGAGGCPKGCDSVGSPVEQVYWQNLWPRGRPTLEQSVPEGLQAMEWTYTGAGQEELVHVGRTHVGEFNGGMSCALNNGIQLLNSPLHPVFGDLRRKSTKMQVFKKRGYESIREATEQGSRIQAIVLGGIMQFNLQNLYPNPILDTSFERQLDHRVQIRTMEEVSLTMSSGQIIGVRDHGVQVMSSV
ncbi:hypothetical protein DUI87_18050 [Hirundo rustica rustica]|uniref:Uncharacterized protein n=1 Tax=Hirundo rustica rustica TaxID=333673 RepID=A0A3M0JV44_HIRRU|nr:hypothetical protein DUI87_18050 [Hirundo rustica rustica]